MASYIGIDLGTTFSAVAYIDETGRPKIINNDRGDNVTPSCVALKGGKLIVGEVARKEWGNAPDQAAARFKRDMGTSTVHTINDVELSPTELSAEVLRSLKVTAENEVGNITEAVVTIPANFAHEAREATMEAANQAGLTVKYIINEPTAAALYYAFENGNDLHGHYVVYDLGGGTFDVSVIKVDGQDIDVVSSNGLAKLGGDDFDRAIWNLVADKYHSECGKDLDPEDFPINDAEQEKISLSGRKRSTAQIGRDLIDLSRLELEEAFSSFIAQTEMLCESTVDEADIEMSDIKGVYLAGGSTRIPLVAESVEKVFGQKPIASGNVDEVVALGAALYAAFKSDKSDLTTVQKQSIGKIKVAESTSMCFGTIAVLVNEERNTEELGNSILIHKGERIPVSVSKAFFTAHQGQTSVNCRITESRSAETDPKFVKIIWEGDLDLPEGRDRGQEIQISYSYDENQVMSAKFLDVASGQETKIDMSLGSQEGTGSAIDKFIVE